MASERDIFAFVCVVVLASRRGRLCRLCPKKWATAVVVMSLLWTCPTPLICSLRMASCWVRTVWRSIGPCPARVSPQQASGRGAFIGYFHVDFLPDTMERKPVFFHGHKSYIHIRKLWKRQTIIHAHPQIMEASNTRNAQQSRSRCRQNKLAIENSWRYGGGNNSHRHDTGSILHFRTVSLVFATPWVTVAVYVGVGKKN